MAKSDAVLKALGATPVGGSHDDVADWRGAMKGHEVLVHAAWPITVCGDAEVPHCQIVTATLALAEFDIDETQMRAPLSC